MLFHKIIGESAIMAVLKDPKGERPDIESNFTDVAAYEVVKKIPNEFARSLTSKYPNLSASQRYWLHKLAVDEKNQVVIQLDSNLEEFCRKFRFLQFRLDLTKNPEHQVLGKVKIKIGEKVGVWSGERFCGHIKEDKFLLAKNCPPILVAQIELFAKAPVAILEIFGRATGVCCICGRQLTNEESVARGIGPICASEYGISVS